MVEYIVTDLDGGRVSLRPLMTPEEASRELERIQRLYPFDTFQVATVTPRPAQGLDKILTVLFAKGER